MRPLIVNVHAQGGRAMMTAAADAARDQAVKIGATRPIVLGVTVLTSLDDADLNDIGVTSKTVDQVVRLARLTKDSGLDGVVCSGEEIEPLRRALGDDFKLLTPGIRPAWSATGDQKRILTPAEAIKRGADFLVIGRPISEAPNPRDAAQRVADEIAAAA
jgi:orotidine-5'-phosphate decarboxylase